MIDVSGTGENWTTICRCGSGEVAVEPEAMFDTYAVHLTISNGNRGPGYTITHRPSGFAVWHVREFAAAIAVAKWLGANLVLPETLEAVTHWKQNLAPVERTRLVVVLTSIAPREWCGT